MRQPQLRLMTVEDWENLPEDGNRYEILEGGLEVTPPPHTDHQEISGFLFGTLWTHIRARGLGKIFTAPVGVVFAPKSVCEPDLVFIRSERVDQIITDGRIQGPPDLVIEILSPGTARRDRITKLHLYAQYGVPEYWIVDPKARAILLHSLTETGYGRPQTFGPGTRLVTPTLPGLEFDVDEVFPARRA